MDLANRYADLIVSRAPVVVLVMLALTGVVVAGAVVGDMGGEASVGDVESESEQAQALDRINANFNTDNGTVAQVVVRGENTLSRESLLATLRLQQAIRESETIAPTLQQGESTVGLANLVAVEAIRAEQGGGPPGGEDDSGADTESMEGGAGAGTQQPTLAEQIEQLESMSDKEVEAVVERLLDPDRQGPGDPYAFLPSDYEEGTTTATSRTFFVFQQDLDDDTLQESQVAIDDLADGLDEEAFVFGVGIVNAESAQALVDSFIILLPIAFVLVLTVFTLAYRDPADILLGVFGIVAVLAWMAGVMGWLGLESSQLLIAVPFLLIGLAIDYSLHVVMRYREARAAGEPTPKTGMALGLAGVIGALAAATVSTGVGFFSNIVSPIPAIQDFAIISAAGIGATLIVFGSLIPALKVLVDDLLERIGERVARDETDGTNGGIGTRLHSLVFKRDKRAIGAGGGSVGSALTSVVDISRRAPLVVLVLALLLAAGGGVAATEIDTEFNQQDFLPEEPPEWTSSLPGPFATGEYEVRRNAEFVGERFDSPGGGGDIQILIEPDGSGDAITDPETLRAIDRATANAAEKESVVRRADGTAAGTNPVAVLRAIAAEHPDVAEQLAELDENGDGLPDRNVAQLYDAMFEADEDTASTVIARDDGEYTALRMTVGVSGDASAQDAARDGEAIASEIDGVDGINAIATGGPVLNGIVQDDLLDTLVQAFVITVVVILAFLALLYGWIYRAPDIGVITLLPVICALAWLLGAMWYLEIPFNSETAVITSLAIGLGVDYSIHLTERILEECTGSSLESGLKAAVQGTGGALLGSASTTAAGFAVLAFALVPPLRRFGTVTALSIAFAYIACLTVLPSLFVLRSRLVGIPGASNGEESDTPGGAGGSERSGDDPVSFECSGSEASDEPGADPETPDDQVRDSETADDHDVER